MKFPILYLPSTSGDIWPLTDDRRLRRSFETELPGFKNSTIISSDGILHHITEARREGWGTMLWGYHPMFNKRLIRIKIIVSSAQSIPLDNAKTLLIQHINKTRGKWTARVFGSRENLRGLIEGAATWEDLFNVLLFDTDS